MGGIYHGGNCPRGKCQGNCPKWEMYGGIILGGGGKFGGGGGNVQ